MPSVLMNFVIAFAELFSKPVFARVKILLTGAILSPVSRTVTNALRVMGLSQEKHFENYHRVLNRDQWSSLKGSQILLNLLVKTFGLSGELVIGFDDTIERRWGEKIKARGIYRDAVRSSKSFFVKASGLRWLSFMLLTEVPFAKKVWALPFLTVLCPSERYDEERGIRHRKLSSSTGARSAPRSPARSAAQLASEEGPARARNRASVRCIEGATQPERASGSGGRRGIDGIEARRP